MVKLKGRAFIEHRSSKGVTMTDWMRNFQPYDPSAFQAKPRALPPVLATVLIPGMRKQP